MSKPIPMGCYEIKITFKSDHPLKIKYDPIGLTELPEEIN